MKNSFTLYEKHEVTESERLGSSKPIVARAVAKLLKEDPIIAEDIGWSKFEEIKTKIINL